MRAFFVVFLTGCASSGLLTTAKTVTPGRPQLAVALEGMAMPSGSRVVPAGNVSAAVRFGLGDRVDLGLSASLLSLGADARVQLVRSDTIDFTAGLGASVAFQVLNGGDFIAGQPVLGAQVPLFLGFNVGAGHQLIVNPRLVYEHWVRSGGLVGSHGLLAGANVGLSLALSNELKLLPFVGVTKSLTSWIVGPTVTPIPSNQRDLVIHVGIGLVNR